MATVTAYLGKKIETVSARVLEKITIAAPVADVFAAGGWAQTLGSNVLAWESSSSTAGSCKIALPNIFVPLGVEHPMDPGLSLSHEIVAVRMMLQANTTPSGTPAKFQFYNSAGSLICEASEGGGTLTVQHLLEATPASQTLVTGAQGYTVKMTPATGGQNYRWFFVEVDLKILASWTQD